MLVDQPRPAGCGRERKAEAPARGGRWVLAKRLVVRNHTWWFTPANRPAIGVTIGRSVTSNTRSLASPRGPKRTRYPTIRARRPVGGGSSSLHADDGAPRKRSNVTFPIGRFVAVFDTKRYSPAPGPRSLDECSGPRRTCATVSVNMPGAATRYRCRIGHPCGKGSSVATKHPNPIETGTHSMDRTAPASVFQALCRPLVGILVIHEQPIRAVRSI